MKKNSVLITILSSLFLLLPAASGAQIIFERWYGGGAYDTGFSVAQTDDGGYIITGETMSFGAGGFDLYLIKTDTNGDTLWTKTFGGTINDEGWSVAQDTTDGGYIIAGCTRSFGSGSGDVYLIKTDTNGDTLWTRTYGGTDFETGRSVALTDDGGYIIAGYTESFGAGDYDVYLINTDENGDTLWTKTFGGTDLDIGFSVAQTDDGGYIITGYTFSFSSTGPFEVYLIKTDADGNTLWTKTYGAGGGYGDAGVSVVQTDDGGYIIVGNTQSAGDLYGDVYLIKTDSLGDTLWTKSYGLPGYQDYASSVAKAKDGGYIIAGFTNTYLGAGSYDVYLIKTDAYGTTLWTKTFGGTDDDRGTSVVQTADGNYIIAGYTKSFGAGTYDVYLIKLKPDTLDYKQLEEGGNWVSFPVLTNPAGTNALEVLEPILDPDILDGVYFENNTEPVIWYEFNHQEWINDLPDENFRSIDGYKIQMITDAELPISGFLEDPDIVFLLEAEQENWIGYFLPYSQTPEDAFASIWNNLTFIKADGWGLIRIGDEIYKGKGDPSVDYGKLYIVGVKRDCIFTWGDWHHPKQPYERTMPELFTYEEQADYMPVFVDSTEALNGIDEIGVFLGDECIGASVVEGFPVFIPAYIDEDSTGSKDYNELTFQVASYGKSGKRSIPAFVYNETQDAFVQEPVILDAKSYAIVRLGTGEGIEFPKKFALYQNYPNPVQGSTTISFSLPEGAENAEIQIYNLKGQLVKDLGVTGYKLRVGKAIWDRRDNKGNQLSNGIYFYKLISGEKTAVKKMVLMR